MDNDNTELIDAMRLEISRCNGALEEFRIEIIRVTGLYEEARAEVAELRAEIDRLKGGTAK